MKPEFKIISQLIDENSQVLDVGCGDGILMDYLIEEKKVNIRGIEISKTKVQNCIAKGLTIIEGNAEKDLRQFPDKSFDYVILSQTLQAFLNPEKVINELKLSNSLNFEIKIIYEDSTLDCEGKVIGTNLNQGSFIDKNVDEIVLVVDR